LLLKKHDFLAELELTLQPRTGDPFFASISGSVERDVTGQISHVRWLIRDITERKRWQERILSAYAELEQRVDERTCELQEAFVRERKIAKVLQERLLDPVCEDAIDGIRLGTCYQPAGDDLLVGGDFYDVYQRSDGTVALAVGDVSGKGLEAASHTAAIKYTLRGLMLGAARADEAIAILNAHLCASRNYQEGDPFFVTLCLVVLDPATGMGSVTAAGSERPAILRASGEIEALDISGLPLGVVNESPYVENRIRLCPGDRLIMLTDGVTEARKGHDLLGTDRFLTIAAQTRGFPVSAAAEHIVLSACDFAGGALHDDACVLMVEKR
jgi:serine phosphatase RsbU (regulator of sigma subunit)